MKRIRTLAGLIVFIVSAVQVYPAAFAQSAPAATKALELSAFAAGTGTFTDILGGKNLGITAGADLTYLRFRLFRPSLEVRGTYPVKKGTIASQKNLLFGPKVEVPLGRFHPYVDFFVGRGQIDYAPPGFTVNTPFSSTEYFSTLYLNTVTTVYSPGGGVDYNVTGRIAVKADVQYQQWSAPVATTGIIHPVTLTAGGVYRFEFSPRRPRSR